MAAVRLLFTLVTVGILWVCALGLQRPPPRYSQQLMPETSFTCAHKIIGSYYADAETDCQLFHVCVSVAGSIQDYRFLCPNDTAFDQESQTCADWYDVDCEAATLYYASDNFDLYRLGSGLESVHYDNLRSDAEPLDNLQRSESSDPVRSAVNSLNRAASSTNSNSNNRDLLKGSSTSNFYNSRNNGKDDDYDNDKVYRGETESRNRGGVRKIARKQQYSGSNTNNNNGNSNNNNLVSSTASPTFENQDRNNYQQQNNGNYQNSGNYQKENNFNQRPTSNSFVSSTTARSYTEQDNFGRVNQRYNTPSTTYKPTTRQYQENYSNQPANSYNNNFNSNRQFNDRPNFPTTAPQSQSTTLRTTEYATSNQNNQAFTNQYNQFSTLSTTLKPTTNFQSTEYTNFQQKNYNNIQRSTSVAATFQTTTPSAANVYNDYSNGARSSFPSSPDVTKSSTVKQQDFSQTTPRYVSNNYAGSSYIPTTYSPATKKFPSNENTNQGQPTTRGVDQYSAQYEPTRITNNGQYRERTSQQTSQAYKNTQSYDTTRPIPDNNDGQYREQTRAPKKATQFNNYEATNDRGGKYNSDATTRNQDNFDQGKSSPITGFSPASINKLAESPIISRPTTPIARRPVNNSPSTQRPTTVATRGVESQTATIPRSGSFSSVTPRPFASTTRSVEKPFTTPKPKTAKKNDYDYAYYDNTGPLEYDGLDFEHVSNVQRETAKIQRN